MSFSYLIIDNNAVNATRIKLLFNNFPNYVCVGIVSDELQIIDHLYKYKPQLVLLNLSNELNNSVAFFATIAELYSAPKNSYRNLN
jgi:DNA-binding NarL/FixJ family response regulator